MGSKKKYSILFFILLVMPFVQTVNEIVPMKKLHGVETKVEKPSFSVTAWLNGQYARDFELYLTANIGFRSIAIRTLNQIRFAIFRDVSRAEGTQIIVGKNDWLFEKVYAEKLIFDPTMTENQLMTFSELLSFIQAKLAEKGIAFSLVISPSKAEIYKDKLPKNILAKIPKERTPTNRERLIPYLNKKDVRYLDAHAFFVKIKPDSDILFAPGGTHWNYYGSFLVCRELIQLLNNKTNICLPIPNLESIQYKEALGTDKDLVALLNLLWYQSNRSSIPYPNVVVEALPMDMRPNVLIAGDSFALTLIDSLRSSPLVRDIDLMYYNTKLFSYPSSNGQIAKGPINHATFDWEEILSNKKIVILEINEIQISRLSWGFLQALAKHFNPDILYLSVPSLSNNVKDCIDCSDCHNRIQRLVTEIYIATFGRAPSFRGLMYWSNAVETGYFTIDMVAHSIFDQPETQEIFAGGASNTEFITTIFQNAFNRKPAQAGLSYWVDALDRGQIRPDQAIMAIINGANATTGNSEDAAMLAKKTEIGVFFANSLIGHSNTNDHFITWAKEIINRATSSEFTIEDAEDYISELYNINFDH